MSHEMEALAGVVRGVMAGTLLLMFTGLWIWVFSKRQRRRFEAAARLPLEEDGLGADRP